MCRRGVAVQEQSIQRSLPADHHKRIILFAIGEQSVSQYTAIEQPVNLTTRERGDVRRHCAQTIRVAFDIIPQDRPIGRDLHHTQHTRELAKIAHRIGRGAPLCPSPVRNSSLEPKRASQPLLSLIAPTLQDRAIDDRFQIDASFAPSASGYEEDSTQLLLHRHAQPIDAFVDQLLVGV